VQKLSWQGQYTASPDVRFADGHAGKELIPAKNRWKLRPLCWTVVMNSLRTFVRLTLTVENSREYPSMFAVSTNCREKTSGNRWSSPNA
jgi:hypothetical protein